MTASPQKMRCLTRSGQVRASTVLAGVVITTGWALWAPQFLGAANTPTRGDARIVTPDDTRDPLSGTLLSSGGSSTAFSFGLPEGAGCQEDSATGEYRVQSYMVMGETDITALQFDSIGPRPAAVGNGFTQPLFDATSTASYVNAFTAKAETNGARGLIRSVPAFNFAVFSPGDIPPGTYNVGLACTLGPPSVTQLKAVWNAQIAVESDASDPLGIKWSVASSTAANRSAGVGNSLTISLPSGGTTPSGVPSAATPLSGEGTPAASVSASDSGSMTTANPTTERPLSAKALAARSGPASGGEVAQSGGDPRFTPLMEILTQVPRTEASIWTFLGWATVLVIFGRLVVLTRRVAASVETTSL